MASQADKLKEPKLRTIYRSIVVGLIVSRDGKFLLGMKNPAGGGVYPDCWHIPGGGIEKDETDLEALRREMAEEVGVNIDEAETLLLDDQGKGESEKTLKDTGEKVLCKMTFKVYKINMSQNASNIAVIPGDDIDKTIWVEPTNLVKYKLTPPSVDLFTRLAYFPLKA